MQALRGAGAARCRLHGMSAVRACRLCAALRSLRRHADAEWVRVLWERASRKLRCCAGVRRAGVRALHGRTRCVDIQVLHGHAGARRWGRHRAGLLALRCVGMQVPRRCVHALRASRACRQ